MKRTQLALCVLALGFTGIAQAASPADAEASYSLPAASSWAEKHAGSPGAQSGFPADAEAAYTQPERSMQSRANKTSRSFEAQDLIAFRGNLDD
jgi:hypothetical protein